MIARRFSWSLIEILQSKYQISTWRIQYGSFVSMIQLPATQIVQWGLEMITWAFSKSMIAILHSFPLKKQLRITKAKVHLFFLKKRLMIVKAANGSQLRVAKAEHHLFSHEEQLRIIESNLHSFPLKKQLSITKTELHLFSVKKTTEDRWGRAPLVPSQGAIEHCRGRALLVSSKKDNWETLRPSFTCFH